MKPNDKIRYKISHLLDIVIPPNGWEEYISLLDAEGIPNRRQMVAMLMIICRQIELLEELLDKKVS